MKKVYIVIVLYKLSVSESLSYKALKRNIRKFNGMEIKVLLYNNSPEIEIPFSNDYDVFVPQENKMLAGAYNYALSEASSEGYEWLLLLDQDTELTDEYFDKLCEFLSSESSLNFDVAVPILNKDNLTLSPESYSMHNPYWTNRKITSNLMVSSLSKSEIFVAFNSASLLRVSLLNSVGGFGDEFPLDMLDHYYYYKLNKARARFFILSTVIQQNLSVLDKNNPMSINRYQIFIESNSRYARLLGIRSLISFKVRLLGRMMIQLFVSDKRQYLKYTIKQLITI